MISHVLLAMLAGASAPPSNPNVERLALTHCLSAMVKTDLQAKTAPDAFATKANAACMAEEAAFRAKSIAADRAVGIRAADAEQNAKSEITDIRQNALDRYKDYLESNTLPR
ncbi:MAG: hypothetical protein QOH04_1786 [Sphingomonadales bacterium]|jgi:hypothetical protein|nr:hypothetical protein [Sphingomonadales bacterium]MEA3036021.1 hypothetical protein [Sphingomonadales bacterium]